MEWIDPGLDDDARALQFSDPDRAGASSIVTAMKLGELGEDELLRQLLPDLPLNAQVKAGSGDDCAVVRFGSAKKLLLLKTDCVVEGVHFEKEAKPEAVGWKAMARPLSDF